MSYHESIAFGGGGVSLKGQNLLTEVFIGANYSSSQKIQTTAKAAGGIDTGNEKGMYRLLYECSVRCVEKFATKAANITFTLWESNDNDTFTAGSSWTTTIAKINEARRMPVSFPLPSCTARYIVLGIKISGGTASGTEAPTAGMIVAQAVPTSY